MLFIKRLHVHSEQKMIKLTKSLAEKQYTCIENLRYVKKFIKGNKLIMLLDDYTELDF